MSNKIDDKEKAGIKTLFENLQQGASLPMEVKAGGVLDSKKKSLPKDAESQFHLGFSYLRGGNGIEQDEGAAFEMFKHAADQGHARGQVWLGICHGKGIGTEKNRQETMRLFNLVEKQDDKMALTTVAACYFYGVAITQDATKAAQLYKSMADQGFPLAQTKLGICYEKGWGVKKDSKKATRLYQLAMDQGFIEAQVQRARHYELGIGGGDIEKAVELYLSAASKGDADAPFYLGIHYKYFIDDQALAFQLIQLAANRGCPEALLSLSECYAKGFGIPKDFDESNRLCELWNNAINDKIGRHLLAYRPIEAGESFEQESLQKRYLNDPFAESRVLSLRSELLGEEILKKTAVAYQTYQTTYATFFLKIKQDSKNSPSDTPPSTPSYAAKPS